MREKEGVGDAPAEKITLMLHAWRAGDQDALQRLMPFVHRELKQIAAGYMRFERPGHTLQVSALVNEAYLRLVDVEKVDWRDRSHFYAISAQMMRRILVDHARSKGYQKRGGGARVLEWKEEVMLAAGRGSELIELDDALAALEKVDPRKAKVVELRFFGGLSVEETAAALDVSEQTVLRDWKLAKAWLGREMSKGGS